MDLQIRRLATNLLPTHYWGAKGPQQSVGGAKRP